MEVLKYRKDAESPWQEIVALKGDKGDQGPQGEKGEPGDTYTLTEDDKTEIANIVLAAIPSSEEVSY